MAYEREPDSETRMDTGRGQIFLRERLEDVIEPVDANALAVVADDELHDSISTADSHDDATTAGGELDRVRHQVPHDLT